MKPELKRILFFFSSFFWCGTAAVAQADFFENDSLQEVVITATSTPKKFKDVPIYTRVISRKDIENSGQLSLNEILMNEMPGIQFGNEAGVPNINMQGLGGNYVLILIDGQRTSGETRNNIDYAMINPSTIERIEIVKGAYATLYGSNAIGGIINIITKNNKKPWEASIAASIKSKQFYQAEMNAGGRQRKFSWLTSVKQSLQQGYELQNTNYGRKYYPDTIIADHALNTWQVEGGKLLTIDQKVSYSPTQKLLLNLKGNYSIRERFNAGAEGEVLHNFFYNIGGLFTGSYHFDSLNALRLFYNYNDYRKANHYRKLNEQADTYSSSIHNVRIVSENMLNRKNQLVSGLELLNESLITYMFQAGRKYQVNTLSAYVQNDYKPFSRLEILTGLRLDHHSDFGSHLSPNLALKADVFSRWQLRASFAGGFRSPSLKELHTDWDHLGMFQIIGSRDLKPEVSNNLMLTLTYRPKKSEWTVNVFRNDIKNKIALFPNTTGDTIFYHNDERQKIFGFEITSAYRILNNWKIFAGYAYTDDGLKSGGKRTSTTRPGGAVLKTDYFRKINNFFTTFSLSGKYQQHMDVYGFDADKAQYYRQEYPAVLMWRLNTLVQYRNTIDLNFAIDNLFNYRPKIYNFYMPMTPGRIYQLTLRYRFDNLLNKK